MQIRIRNWNYNDIMITNNPWLSFTTQMIQSRFVLILGNLHWVPRMSIDPIWQPPLTQLDITNGYMQIHVYNWKHNSSQCTYVVVCLCFASITKPFFIWAPLPNNLHFLPLCGIKLPTRTVVLNPGCTLILPRELLKECNT